MYSFLSLVRYALLITLLWVNTEQLRLSLGSRYFDQTKHHEIEVVIPIEGCYKCYKARNNDLTRNKVCTDKAMHTECNQLV